MLSVIIDELKSVRQGNTLTNCSISPKALVELLLSILSWSRKQDSPMVTVIDLILVVVYTPQLSQFGSFAQLSMWCLAAVWPAF